MNVFLLINSTILIYYKSFYARFNVSKQVKNNNIKVVVWYNMVCKQGTWLIKFHSESSIKMLCHFLCQLTVSSFYGRCLCHSYNDNGCHSVNRKKQTTWSFWNSWSFWNTWSHWPSFEGVVLFYLATNFVVYYR